MITPEKLIEIGLKESGPTIDQSLTYMSYDFSSNGSYIGIVNILDKKGIVKKQIISINDREIPKALSLNEVKNFISLISDNVCICFVA